MIEHSGQCPLLAQSRHPDRVGVAIDYLKVWLLGTHLNAPPIPGPEQLDNGTALSPVVDCR